MVMSSGRVAVVTTGGTIGSVITGGVVVSGPQGGQTRAAIERAGVGGRFNADIFPALDTMSENMTPADWLVLIQTIDRLIHQGYRHIVVTHGSDTMAYSAAALALYFNDNRQGAKICLTGAFYPIEHPESDAIENLVAAFEAVCSDRLAEGVYLAFRTAPGSTGIYHGLEVNPIPYDSSSFAAPYGKLAALYARGGIEHVTPKRLNFSADCPFPGLDGLRTAGSHIYRIPCYPGLDLSIFAAPRQEKRLIIVEAYHCGTASSEQAAGTIIGFKRSNPAVQVALSCMSASLTPFPYQSTMDIMAAGAAVFADVTPLLIYVLAACRFAADVRFETLLDPIAPWLVNTRYETPAG